MDEGDDTIPTKVNSNGTSLFPGPELPSAAKRGSRQNDREANEKKVKIPQCQHLDTPLSQSIRHRVVAGKWEQKENSTDANAHQLLNKKIHQSTNKP
jgi:hypothetical protein